MNILFNTINYCKKILINCKKFLNDCNNFFKDDNKNDLVGPLYGGSEQKAINVFMKRNIDVNLQNDLGETTLHRTILRGNAYKSIKALITLGANINIVDENGISPLMMACSRDFAHYAKELIEAKANIDLKDKNNKTALMIACDSNSVSRVDLILKYLENINDFDYAECIKILVNNHMILFNVTKYNEFTRKIETILLKLIIFYIDRQNYIFLTIVVINDYNFIDYVNKYIENKKIKIGINKLHYNILVEESTNNMSSLVKFKNSDAKNLFTMICAYII